MNKIYFLLFLLVFFACGKNALNLEYRSVVLEYPSLKPVTGASVQLFKCADPFCTYGNELLGTFVTNAQGEIFQEELVLPSNSTKINKPGYAQTHFQGESVSDGATIYYLAQKSWFKLSLLNALPSSDLDTCFISITQLDSLLLTPDPYQGILTKSIALNSGSLFGSFGSEVLQGEAAGGVYARVYAQYRSDNIWRDSSFAFFCPPGDTAFVHFEY